MCLATITLMNAADGAGLSAGEPSHGRLALRDHVESAEGKVHGSSGFPFRTPKTSPECLVRIKVSDLTVGGGLRSMGGGGISSRSAGGRYARASCKRSIHERTHVEAMPTQKLRKTHATPNTTRPPGGVWVRGRPVRRLASARYERYRVNMRGGTAATITQCQLGSVLPSIAVLEYKHHVY